MLQYGREINNKIKFKKKERRPEPVNYINIYCSFME